MVYFERHQRFIGDMVFRYMLYILSQVTDLIPFMDMPAAALQTIGSSPRPVKRALRSSFCRRRTYPSVRPRLILL
jgi:hypothetical protein